MFFPNTKIHKIMNYAFITTFIFSNNRRLRIAEEWLLENEEHIKTLLSIFDKSDFQQLSVYEIVGLRTALMSKLDEAKKLLFCKLLDSIAIAEDEERLEPFSSFGEIGISLEPEAINYFYKTKKHSK